VAVTRTLSEKEPAFYAQVSEIDVSEPGMIVLRLDAESYDLRLSREDYLRNLENYFALRDQIRNDDTGAIEYVDLRWQDRIAVMPAAKTAAGSDTNRNELHERIEQHALVNGGR
jgi:cell division septal protein FtsQ